MSVPALPPSLPPSIPGVSTVVCLEVLGLSVPAGFTTVFVPAGFVPITVVPGGITPGFVSVLWLSVVTCGLGGSVDV